jgi:hypothetical protein
MAVHNAKQQQYKNKNFAFDPAKKTKRKKETHPKKTFFFLCIFLFLLFVWK